MGLIDIASGKSVWRGLDYYETKKVISWEKAGTSIYKGRVSGTDGQIYDVEIDKVHPKKSKCNCPFAEGRKVICKHMIALYFSSYPKEAKKYYNDVIKYQDEEEQRQEELENKVIDYVHKLKKSDLEQLLLQVLFDGPEWQYERFIHENIDW